MDILNLKMHFIHTIPRKTTKNIILVRTTHQIYWRKPMI